MIQVACVADEAFLPHCAAMLSSLLRWHPDAQVHFLHGPELSVEAMQKLGDMVVEQGGGWLPHEIPDAWIEDLPRLSNIPPLMWYRAYLPELLPTLDRILYLDADTLVVDDLTVLWEQSLEGVCVAAVDNVLERPFENWAATLGLAKEQGYFNSGVMLLNLAEMRRRSSAKALVEFGRQSRIRLNWPDQDAFNCILGTARMQLHPRWNCQNSLFYYTRAQDVFGAEAVREATTSPAILHFEGGAMAKPWHYLCRHPYRKAYIEARTRTPWPDVVFEGKSRFGPLLRLLPMNALIEFYKVRHRIRVFAKRVFG